jgi:gliding motility-associated-like protein
LKVATANNCSAEITKSTSIIPVQLFTSPAKDTNAVTGQPVQITVSGADTYIWQPFVNLSNAGTSNPVFTATATGIYPLIVEGTTIQGCKGNASINIKVFSANNLILIPNAFSPNSDGLNDKFHITCTGLQSLTGFTIFNRYGQIVYQQNTCFAVGWDGNFKGSAQPLGTYVYHWQGINFNGKKVSGKGALILVR